MAGAKRRPWAEDEAVVRRLFEEGRLGVSAASTSLALMQAYPQHRDKLVEHLSAQPAEHINVGLGIDLSLKSVLARAELERPKRRVAAVKAAGSRQVVRAAPSGDPAYELNPIAGFYRGSEVHRATYAAATTASAPPTLFESGDLPLVCASGMDPTVLLRLPWGARHAAAEAPTLAAAMRIVEDFSGPDAAVSAELEFGGHEGNRAYAERVTQWMLSAPPEAE